MREPNQHDAALYLQLHALKDSSVQAEARAWFFQHFSAGGLDELNQRYAEGSRERLLFHRVLGFYESAGVLVSRELLHEDVYFDAPFAFELVWPRVRRIIEELRQQSTPPPYENVIWLGRRYETWLETRGQVKREPAPPNWAPE